jgi:hypothetical protein
LRRNLTFGGGVAPSQPSPIWVVLPTEGDEIVRQMPAALRARAWRSEKDAVALEQAVVRAISRG